ncbi:YbaK family protein [Halalkalibacter urbisdiaboli]|uniref:YbaK family protein n=1 Tax=Halalkalibacter urbisdiaboli TaxID=1960589 RepID=UPI000B44E960|nr:YbaK family protein [Halalkalibacter urbisdiaboli]
MAVITTFFDKRREKQWKFERKVLRRVSLKKMKGNVRDHFRQVIPFHFLTHPFLIDPCMDLAIDAYLLGAEYGRFGYLGETEDEVKERCNVELNDLSHSLFDFLQTWLMNEDYLLDSLKITTDVFINEWWEKGFREAEKLLRLKLH